MSRLDEIKARVESATEGPWFVDQITDAGETSYSIAHVARWRGYTNSIHLDEDKDTADFIAHAREDVPWLLGEVERLTAEVALLVKVDAEREYYSPPKSPTPDETGAINALRAEYEAGGSLSNLVFNQRNYYLTWPDSTVPASGQRMVVEGFLAELAALTAENERYKTALAPFAKAAAAIYPQYAVTLDDFAAASRVVCRAEESGS